jgi:indolepyruvate ferredoxin oxidoreductase
MLRSIKTAASPAGADLIDGTGLATALAGESIGSNLFMLGYAFQKGFVPLGLAAIEQAIALNGVAVEANTRLFAFGRLAAHDPARVESLTQPPRAAAPSEPQDLAALVARRAAFLTDYQDAAYARRYTDAVTAVQAAETARGRGRSGFAPAAARALFKLMAYKDEYEVARLYTDGAFLDALHRQFEGSFRVKFHLAPPLLAARDPATGVPRKRAYGAWMLTAFKWLAGLRGLRGTAFDPFGRTAERRMERRLIVEYETLLRELASALTPENHALAVEIASLPEQVRGFGHVKRRAVETVKARQAELLALWRSPGGRASAA